MPRLGKINQKYSQPLKRAATRFRDHEDISRASVARWVGQFDDGDLELAVKTLEKIRYYSGRDIRHMVHELVHRVYQALRDIPRNKVYFIPVGEIFGGAAILARALRDTPGVRPEQIKMMVHLQGVPKESIGAMVFVEDFSGTGNTLKDWWSNVEMLVLPKMAPVVIALLVLNSRARANVEAFASKVVSVDELDENHNVLSPTSDLFDAVEKETLLGYCERTDCQEKYLRGFGSCGLLVAFKHLCPNNSLPLLWHGSKKWRRLFKRRGI